MTPCRKRNFSVANCRTYTPCKQFSRPRVIGNILVAEAGSIPRLFLWCKVPPTQKRPPIPSLSYGRSWIMAVYFASVTQKTTRTPTTMVVVGEPSWDSRSTARSVLRVHSRARYETGAPKRWKLLLLRTFVQWCEPLLESATNKLYVGREQVWAW